MKYGFNGSHTSPDGLEDVCVIMPDSTPLREKRQDFPKVATAE